MGSQSGCDSPDRKVRDNPTTLRRATVEEAEIIGLHRRAMFVDMGYPSNAELDAMTSAFLGWLRRRMDSGEYLAWFAVTPDQSVVAGLGLWLMDWPPHMIGPKAPRANILNVYTQPDYRRRGLARQLVETALAWCRENRIGCVILHASSAGTALYTSLGFEATNEMRLII